MKALITGITGFAGRHLADFLSARKGVEVHGLSRTGDRSSKNIHACDVQDAAKVGKLILKIRPDRIYHLAAQSSVAYSWEHPKETFEQNLMGTLNVLDAARRLPRAPRIQLAGSAQEYGIPPKNKKIIDENVPMNPLSPYSVSKVSQDLMACQYVLHYGMKIVRTRAFNHIGPGQAADFVTSSFARQVARIEAGLQRPEIFVGNLDSVRDYTDVRDMVRAYWYALEKGEEGEVYNIASGDGRTVREILDVYLKLSPAKIAVKVDPARVRANDLPRLVGDSRKFRRRTGWAPRISLETSLNDVLAFWREKTKHEKK